MGLLVPASEQSKNFDFCFALASSGPQAMWPVLAAKDCTAFTGNSGGEAHPYPDGTGKLVDETGPAASGAAGRVVFNHD
jgi:hypothetical protein